MLEVLQKAVLFDAAAHLALDCGAHRVGWVQPAFADALAAHPAVFAREANTVRILAPAELDAAVRALAAKGWIHGWRDERYEVRAGAETLFTLERAAFRPFGLLASASHLNGWVRDGAAVRLWVARRSAAKPVDPGMLDNLVGGGIAAGSTPLATLEKECMEEAGIPPALLRLAQAAGRLRVTRAVENGVNDEVIHAWDLELPGDFVPANQDGEVAGFALLDLDTIAAKLLAQEFTVDAAAVSIDFLWRRGVLADPAVGEALAVLRRRVR
jgi:8-oxo-dGTP pyrophosphatase MutT (NUDIX family)